MKVGGDPEFFVIRNGRIISAHHVFPEKDSAVSITKDGIVYFDGYQAEVNLRDGYPPESYWNKLVEIFSKIEKEYGIAISLQPAIYISKKELRTLPPEACEFHCEPDLNVYNDYVETPDGRNFRMRCIGGHIHIETPLRYSSFIKLLDLFVSLPLTYFSPARNSEYIRRTLYGRAGSYRLKPYGVEYRTPSPVYLSSPEFYRAVIDGIMTAQNVFLGKTKCIDIPDWNVVRNAINDKAYYNALKNIVKDIQETYGIWIFDNKPKLSMLGIVEFSKMPLL